MLIWKALELDVLPGEWESLPLTCINSLFREIPFSQDDRIHEYMQVSLLQGMITKGNFAGCFHSFLRVFERVFLQKSPISL